MLAPVSQWIDQTGQDEDIKQRILSKGNVGAEIPQSRATDGRNDFSNALQEKAWQVMRWRVIMVVLEIEMNQANQRLDKFLGKVLPGAPSGFFYKMLRKKNITLNGKKAEGKAILRQGDRVTLWLADETILTFGGDLPHVGHASDGEEVEGPAGIPAIRRQPVQWTENIFLPPQTPARERDYTGRHTGNYRA